MILDVVWGLLFRGTTQVFWSPSAWGFVALGLCIGLLIGLAQVLLTQSWLRVEAGFRSGRELILSKAELTIGRAESCDIGLFGDPGVEKLHARLIRRGNAYFVQDAGTPAGTFVNDRRVTDETPLRDGDAIRLGRCVLRFRETRRRAA
jgi:pSer/pThr/pTyr-binding forkhead associated (FHA) protein